MTDVEIKMIESSGTPVVNFTVATNRRFKDKNDNPVEQSEYHRCVSYGSAAEIIGKYVTKGKRLYIEGRLRNRKWEDTNGTNRVSTEVVVDKVIFLDSRPSGDKAAATDTETKAPETAIEGETDSAPTEPTDDF